MSAPSQEPVVPASDDRIYPITRIIAAVIIPFLVLAFLILYFLPGETGTRFAWEIKPAMTAAFMGAGYLGGAYFFAHVVFGRRWHRVAPGFLAVTAFTWAMLLATLIHWQRFDLSHFPFQLWLVLYVVTPFLVPWLWWHNRPADPGTFEPDDVEVPRFVRRLTGAIGVLFLLWGVVCFVLPDTAVAAWPWTLSLLTARVLGGWCALMGVGGLVLASERRWSAWRVEVESIFLWQLLVLVAALVHRSDLGPRGNLFLVAELAGLLGFVAIYGGMELRRRRAHAGS